MFNKRIAQFLVGLLFSTVFLSACGVPNNSDNTGLTTLPSGGRIIDPPPQVNDVALTDQTGQPFNLSSLKGKTSLVFFGYTNCPDACPITLSNFTRIKQVLGSDGDKAAFVFISVDPARDTPDVLNTYLKNFDPAFIGLTGSNETLQEIAQNFGAVFSNAGNDQIVGHSTSAFLVDAQGNVRVSYPVQAMPDPIAAEMKDFINAKR